jgi:hypothetical protein
MLRTMNSLLYQLKLLPLLLLLAPFSNAGAAIGKGYHEVTWGGNMLWSSLAPLPGSNVRTGIGFGGGAGYIYHFNDRISFRTGLEVNRYAGASFIEKRNESSTIIIPEEWFWMGDKFFELNSHISGYSVQHSALYVQAPLLFGYEEEVPKTEWLSWYVSGGVKLGYSPNGKSSAQIDSLSTKGLFDYEGYPMEDMKQLLGFGTYLNEHRQAALNLGFSATGYLEVGLKQQLAANYNLYVGIFGEYSLYSAIAGDIHPHMYEYEAQHLSSGSYYKLHYAPASHVAGISSKTSYPMAFGVTVRLSFDTKQAKPSNKRMLQMRYLDF